MENNHIKNVLGLLLSAFLVSTSGALGRYIAMPSEVIIWFRAALAMVFLFIFCKIRKDSIQLKSKKHLIPFIVGGIFMGAHWVTYFYALKMANVAIGMLSLYTFPVMVAFLEPLFLKLKFDPMNIVLAILVLLGVYVLSPEFNIESTTVQGVLFGLLSALCYTIRILILKQYVTQYNGVVLMFYQTVVITVCLSPVLFFMDSSGIQTQWPYIVVLAFVTTAIGHSLMVHSLQFFSASTTSIISSAQPIFGILIAFLFLNEIPTINTYVGGGLILTTVLIESVRSKK